MGVALKLYEQLTDAGEDRERARLIAEAFDALEKRCPEFKDMATQGHVREGELSLQEEIRAVGARLQKEIQSIGLQITEMEVRLIKVIHRQTIWVALATGGVMGLIRWLDVLLK